MAEATEKTAERVYTLDDIKFNEANKGMAAASCIPLIGFIMYFVEKDDLFIKYIGAQAVLVSLLALIPFLGFLVMVVVLLVMFVKVLKGERFDVPVISGIALKIMAKI